MTFTISTTRWDQALLAASEIPPGMVLEGFYKSKLQDSVRLQTVLAMYERENVRNNEPPNCSRLKTLVRRHIDQTMRTRNFRAMSEIVERGAVTKSQIGEKRQRGEESERMLSVEIKWTVFEKETYVVSVMNERLETDAIRDKKDNRPRPAPKAKAQTDGKKPSKSSGKCTNRSCNYWHLPRLSQSQV